MRTLLTTFVVLAMAMAAFGGAVVDEDFNGGVFTEATTDRTDYTWSGPGDSLDGWEVLTGTGGDIADAGTTVSTGIRFSMGNSMPGWATGDGNIGGYYQKENDVPQVGWRFTTTLDDADGGARDDSGNALAFRLFYDLELALIHGSRGAIGSVNANVDIDGTQYTGNDGPYFYRETNPDSGDPYSFEHEPTEMDMSVEGLPVGTALDTSDDGAAAAIRNFAPFDVIEQTVANGSSVSVTLVHGRLNNKTVSPSPANWNYMDTAADNVLLVALEAGDANGDLEVGLSDFAALGRNFGATGAGWTQGDFNGDEEVGLTDFARLGQNFGLVYPVEEAAAASAAAETGEMDLIVDVTTGEAWLDIGEDVTTTGYQIKSADGDLLPDEFTGGLEGLDVPPAGNTETSIAQFALSSVDAPAGELSLGGIFDESGDGTDLTFSWTDGDFNESSGNVVIIPEPATMALLGLGGLAAVIRRKRS